MRGIMSTTVHRLYRCRKINLPVQLTPSSILSRLHSDVAINHETPSSSDAVISQEVPPTSVADDEVTFFFYETGNKKKVEVKGKVGRSLLHLAINHEVDIDNACGGVLACSTCHVTVEKEIYDILPAIDEDETDMLDMAVGFTET